MNDGHDLYRTFREEKEVKDIHTIHSSNAHGRFSTEMKTVVKWIQNEFKELSVNYVSCKHQNEPVSDCNLHPVRQHFKTSIKSKWYSGLWN